MVKNIFINLFIYFTSAPKTIAENGTERNTKKKQPSEFVAKGMQITMLTTFLAQ